jgi:flagellar motor switch protein FliM
VKKVLSQEEIDAILGKARSAGGHAERQDSRVVEPCNFREGGQMSEPYARFMTNLYEGFARSVSNSLGAYLRTHFEMTLASVELMPVRDFLGGFQEAGFVEFLALQPGGWNVLMQLDAMLVFPMIDVLLGGFGAPTQKLREMTEIDQEIMHGIAQVMARQIESIWQPMGLSVRIDQQQKAAQIQSVFSPTDRLAVLTFEARVNQTTGTLTLTIPVALAGAMLRETSSGPRRRPVSGSGKQAGLEDRMLESQFLCTVGLSGLRLPLRALLALQPGSVLDLRRPVKQPASLLLGGQEHFAALPVRSGKCRAAQLLQPIQATTEAPMRARHAQ